MNFKPRSDASDAEVLQELGLYCQTQIGLGELPQAANEEMFAFQMGWSARKTRSFILGEANLTFSDWRKLIKLLDLDPSVLFGV